jgi:multidrug efflux pump subunit AcrB
MRAIVPSFAVSGTGRSRFDQSVFVKEALLTVGHEGIIGLVLTSLMILIFLGSMRARFAVLLSIPISALATFAILYIVMDVRPEISAI